MGSKNSHNWRYPQLPEPPALPFSTPYPRNDVKPLPYTAVEGRTGVRSPIDPGLLFNFFKMFIVCLWQATALCWSLRVAASLPELTKRNNYAKQAKQRTEVGNKEGERNLLTWWWPCPTEEEP